MRGLMVVLGGVLLAAVAVLVLVFRSGPTGSGRAAGGAGTPAAGTGSPAAQRFSDACGTFDTGVRTPYAVTGYWLVPTADHCTWRRQLEAIHQVGGDTVVRIGFGLQPRRVDEEGRILDGAGERPDPRYADCVENGKTCVQAAEEDLRRAHPGNRITWTYAYRSDEAFGPGLFRCPELERTIRTAKTVYYRVIAPDDGSDDASCDFTSKGRGYHLILIAAAASDSLTELLDLADRFGIKVFPALPLAPRDPVAPTRANPRHIGTLTTLTRRILQDYGDRFRDRASFGGVYQPFELQLRKWEEPENVPTLQVYAEQHEIVSQELPGKPILISPYLDARRHNGLGATPAEVGAGFEALARTGVGIIAPQDGRGTGKGALYWPNLNGQPVDERLQPVVGDTTYREAYLAATRDYYRAMDAARRRLAEEDIQVQLWANVEAFEPAATEPCGGQRSRGRTDKARLDTAVAMVGPYVSKIISYMWSDFFTCGSPSLAEQIAADWDRPLPVQAFPSQRDIREGLEIRGYHLGGATVMLSWYGAQAPLLIDAAAVGWHDRTPIPDLPAGVERLWIPVDWSKVPAEAWVRVELIARDGRKSNAPVYYHRGG